MGFFLAAVDGTFNKIAVVVVKIAFHNMCFLRVWKPGRVPPLQGFSLRVIGY